MQVITLGLPISESEKQQYVQYIRLKYSDRIIDKIFLDASEESISIRCEYHFPRQVTKMGGYYLSNPSNWNKAKQAEFLDSLPNPL